jgi:hypothetical protein
MPAVLSLPRPTTMMGSPVQRTPSCRFTLHSVHSPRWPRLADRAFDRSVFLVGQGLSIARVGTFCYSTLVARFSSVLPIRLGQTDRKVHSFCTLTVAQVLQLSAQPILRFSSSRRRLAGVSATVTPQLHDLPAVETSCFEGLLRIPITSTINDIPSDPAASPAH